MTIYGWDASHHDWGRGPVDMAAAVADGIVFATHKAGEGTSYTDPRFDDWHKRARSAKVSLLGAYYVNHPGDQVVQADRFLALLDANAPGWRDGPFVLQVDAEKFDYMQRAPNLSEIKAFCDRLVAKTGGKFRPVVYAPKWLYGDGLRGLGYPLWASAYGSNPAVHYKAAYPGDNSSRWGAYSGQTPTILQYGSRTRIGTQNTCDANAYRGTLTQLRTLVYPSNATEDDVSATDVWNTKLVDPADKTEHKAGDYLRYIEYNFVQQLAPIKTVLAAQSAALAAIRAGLEAGDDIDEATIIAGVLAGLTPQKIAAAIPPELAEQVVEEIRALTHAATAPRG